MLILPIFEIECWVAIVKQFYRLIWNAKDSNNFFTIYCRLMISTQGGMQYALELVNQGFKDLSKAVHSRMRAGKHT